MLKSIPIIIVGTLLLFAPSAQAITKRADKECLLCHVLWFDAFKTDRQTLVERKETAIVVAGSTGYVSTEAMCVTCHDGYVADSRVSVVAGNPHHDLKKKPESMVLPEMLRLDSKNEIYCGTCHTLHDFQESANVGSTTFMRMDNTESQMCVACHDDASRRKADANHPLLKKVDRRMRANAAKMGSEFSPDQELICQSCHNAHGQRALVSSPDNSTICLGCHQNQRGLVDSKHDLRQQLPNLLNVKQQKPKQSGPCGACHIPHNAVGKKLWARKLKPGATASQMCLTCHGPETGIEAKQIGQHSHPLNVQPGDKVGIPKNLPLFMQNATKSSKGSVQCFSCHDVHRWNPTSTTAKGGRKDDGDGSNSFLRMTSSGASTLCVACHADKQGVVYSDHNLAVTAPQEKNIQSRTAAQSGTCSACHVPHHASDKRLWAKSLSGEGDWVSRMCFNCHNKNGAASAKLLSGYNHPVNVKLNAANMAGNLKDRHPSLPMYTQAGVKEKDAMMVCLTCHDPHIWGPASTAMASKPHAADIEGTAANSFLRKANYPESDLCNTCHAHQSQVEGTVHDLKISSPKAINIMNQNVEASGTCGACHLVHNSPNQQSLWARKLGPISENVNAIGALCTSCHAKGNPAEKKVPQVASHPAGKLIMAHEGNVRGKTGFTPVFDEKGLKQGIGNLGCPSCHDGHVRQTGSPTPTAGKSAESVDALQFRFLRNQSFNTICMECHGPEGLFRYLYFHDPAKRGIWVRPRQAHDRSKIIIKK